MKLEPECVGCLFQQMVKAFKTLKPEISNEIIISAQQRLMNYLLEIDINKISAPIAGKFLYDLVAKTLGIKDPYFQQKKKYNELALKQYDRLTKIINNSKDPLFEAIAAAAIGNTIDFASQHKIDLLNDFKSFKPENFKINDYDCFKNRLEILNKDNKKLLMLGDNAGEIVFDKLLIEVIHKIYPKIEIIYTVRSAPIINDATIQDAEFINLTKIVKVIEASPIPGIDLASSTEEFLKYFREERGIILSKGQGNFETLYDIDLSNKDVFFLLKVKCVLLEKVFNVKIGDFIFKQKTRD